MRFSKKFRQTIGVALFIITLSVFYANSYADTMNEEGLLDPRLTNGGTATLTAILPGGILQLQDGRQVKIAGIEIPPGYESKTEKYMYEFSGLNKSPAVPVRLYYDKTREDRYGRIIAFVYSNDWVGFAESIVQQGYARAHSAPDNRAVATTLIGLDREARGYGNELWARPEYAVLTPEQILDKKYWDRFQIVEGRVRDVAEIKKTFYLNFGDDWKTDFTAVIPVNARSLFTAAKIKPKDLKNILVRVRGFTQYRNGPSIELTHPELLEILESVPTSKPTPRKRKSKK